MLPAAMRPHLSAIYAFAAAIAAVAECRSMPAAERLTGIQAWQSRLHVAVDVERSGRAPDPHEDAAVVALAHSIRSLDLPMPLLDDLVSAFGQDTMTTRYASWAELFDYCRRAAQPLGRLLLRVAGYRESAIDESSDALCTALRLTACWRALGDDWVLGRLYVPRDVSAACRAREMDLDAPFLNESWTAAIRQCVDQTRAQFEAGRDVCDALAGGMRRERRWTWLRGMRLLDAVERAGPALKAQRPAIGVRDMPALLWRAARWPPTAS
jgi:phytoene/squalene synthetase